MQRKQYFSIRKQMLLCCRQTRLLFLWHSESFARKKKHKNEQKQRTERLSCHSIWIDGFFKKQKNSIYLEQLESRGLIERSVVILIASNENT